jgi:hypothetical protein
MQHRLQYIPAPNLALANWPCPGARSFIIPDDQFGPIAHRGDMVFVIRTGRVRASGGDFILASGPADKPRYIIAHVEGATASTWNAVTYGYATESVGRYLKTKRQLSRAKWRPVYRCVGYRYSGSDEGAADSEGGAA